MSPIALPHTLAPCPPALWEKGVKWHQQDCSLIADIILLRKICIALFPSQRCQMGRFGFFLAEGMKDQRSGFTCPLGTSTTSSRGTCKIQLLWAAKISGLNFISEMHKAKALVTVSEWGLLSVTCYSAGTPSSPGVFPAGKAGGPAECHISLLHVILLVKLSRKLPVKRLGVEGHTEFNPIKTSLAFPHSWFPGSNKEESSEHEAGKGGTKWILTICMAARHPIQHKATEIGSSVWEIERAHF